VAEYGPSRAGLILLGNGNGPGRYQDGPGREKWACAMLKVYHLSLL